MKKNVLFTLGTVCLLLLWTSCSEENDVSKTNSPDASARKTGTLEKPTITCGTSTQVSIDIIVTAGASGAPAGFSLQWMTAADYAANGNSWYASDDLRLCKASFSGNANASRYNLVAGESVSVNVGEFLFDSGASTNCGDALTCGTQYVFRAFAHATSALMRSEFTANLTCSTLACGADESCTYTQGHWKTHGPVPEGNNVNEWPQDVNDNGLLLGTTITNIYTAFQLQSIFDAPPAGNGLIILAHQLIAAKLNVANGADDIDIALTIEAADDLIGDLVVPPVGSGFLAPGVTSSLTTALRNYNEGATGPGHCD